MRPGQERIGSFRLGLDEDATSRNRSVASSTGIASSSVSVLLSVLANPSSHSNTIDANAIRSASYGRLTASFTGTLSTNNSMLLSLLAAVSSHAASSESNTIRVVKLGRGIDSHVAFVSSDATTIISLTDGVSSHSGPMSSFTYNERTSLKLVDHELSWDDEQAVWYTNWFRESKILGSEDTLALRGMVTPDAKEPAARVFVQYDATGDGVVDEQSEVLETGSGEEVLEVADVPVEPDGWYRLKITEYSGYNSLYDLDLGIIHE